MTTPTYYDDMLEMSTKALINLRVDGWATCDSLASFVMNPRRELSEAEWQALRKKEVEARKALRAGQ